MDPQVIILIIVFSMVFITMRKYLSMKKSGKEIKRWFKVLMFFVLLTGVRHLNPLRWPETAIRAIVLTIHTPIGMSEEDVFLRVINRRRWVTRDPRAPHFTMWRTEVPEDFVRRGRVSARLGRYHWFFLIEMHIDAIWFFDEDGYLTDIRIVRDWLN